MRSQVINFVVRQSQAQAPVCLNQSGPAASQHRHPTKGPGFVMAEQQLCPTRLMKYFLGHSVMQQGCNLLALFKAELARGPHVVSDTALDSSNLPKATVAGNVGGLAGPWRERSRARDDEEQNAI